MSEYNDTDYAEMSEHRAYCEADWMRPATPEQILKGLRQHIAAVEAENVTLRHEVYQLGVQLEASRALARFLADRLDAINKAEWDRQEQSGEVETVCCQCHEHLRGPVGATKVSHGLCDECLVEIEEGTA